MADMARLRAATLAVALVTSGAAVSAQPVFSNGQTREATGGAATVWATGRNAFSFPLANLDDAERSRFAIGNSFFKRNWVEAPASTTARDGLGPHFIARSCGGCHAMDGRGAPPDWNRTLGARPEPSVALLIRLSVPGVPDPRSGVVPEPTYGDQFSTSAVSDVRREGHVEIRTRRIHGRFADGTPYVLTQPVYRLTQLGYGAMAPDVMISPRVAPHLAGLGLLEAVTEADILANQADQASRAGPIKGKVNRVWDAFAQSTILGRFGWKANTGTLAHQGAGAFVGDMGITSRTHPTETCTHAQQDCLSAAHGGGTAATGAWKPAREATAQTPEIADDNLSHVVFYTATLAPAARRQASTLAVRRGEALFHAAQCAVCHRPSYVTGPPPFPALSTPKVAGNLIWPYTDFLLHDMGEALADGRPDFQATGRQWKTPPLWGIGLIREVNGHQRLLHDGRAAGVLEAILWHGGEGSASRDRVLKMTAQQRQDLVRFVESL